MSKAGQASQFTRRFLDLQDVPASYSGQASKLVRVNGAANALEFSTPPTQISTWLGLTDTPDTYSGWAGAGVKVNDAGNALTFGLQQPRYNRTVAGAELNVTIPTTISDNIWKTIYRLDLSTSLAANDMLTVTSHFEVRNDYDINTEIAFALWLTNVASPNDSTDIEGDGIYIAQPTGHNVKSSGKHYADGAICGTIRVSGAYATPRIFLRARAKSSDATGAQSCTIMQGYNHVDVIVFPKGSI